jgi:hypothetical protein
MAARITEVEDAAENARNRAGKLEKERNKIQVELREAIMEVEAVIWSDCCLFFVQ